MSVAPSFISQVIVTLPFPPSANTLWRAVQGRNIMSERYRQWKGHALALVMIQRPGKLAGPYRMTVVATRPDKRPRDLDNLLKPLGDLLKSAGVIRDDSDARSIFIQWSDGEPDKAGGVRIVLEAA